MAQLAALPLSALTATGASPTKANGSSTSFPTKARGARDYQPGELSAMSRDQLVETCCRLDSRRQMMDILYAELQNEKSKLQRHQVMLSDRIARVENTVHSKSNGGSQEQASLSRESSNTKLLQFSSPSTPTSLGGPGVPQWRQPVPATRSLLPPLSASTSPVTKSATPLPTLNAAGMRLAGVPPWPDSPTKGSPAVADQSPAASSSPVTRALDDAMDGASSHLTRTVDGNGQLSISVAAPDVAQHLAVLMDGAAKPMAAGVAPSALRERLQPGTAELSAPEELMLKMSPQGMACLTWFYDEQVLEQLQDPQKPLKRLSFEVRQQSEGANGRLRSRTHNCDCRGLTDGEEVGEQGFDVEGCVPGKAYAFTVRAKGEFEGRASAVFSSWSETVTLGAFSHLALQMNLELASTTEGQSTAVQSTAEGTPRSHSKEQFMARGLAEAASTEEAASREKEEREKEIERRMVEEAEQRRLEQQEMQRRVDEEVRTRVEAERLRLEEGAKRKAAEESERVQQTLELAFATEREYQEKRAQEIKEHELELQRLQEHHASEAAKRQAIDEARRQQEIEREQVSERERQVLAEEAAFLEQERQRMFAEEEVRRQAEEEAAHKRTLEDQLVRTQRAEEETRRRTEDEIRRLALEEEAKRRLEEARKRAEAEENRRVEEEGRRRAAEAAQRQRAEEEARRIEEAAEEAMRKQHMQINEEAERRIAEEAKQRAEEARLREENMQRQLFEQRRQVEEEAKRKDHEARLREDALQRRLAEQIQKRTEEEQQKREALAGKQRAEDEAKRIVEEERQKVAQSEAKRRAEEGAKLKMREIELEEEELRLEQEDRLQREAEEEFARQHALAQEDARKRQTEEARRKVEEEMQALVAGGKVVDVGQPDDVARRRVDEMEQRIREQQRQLKERRSVGNTPDGSRSQSLQPGGLLGSTSFASSNNQRTRSPPAPSSRFNPGFAEYVQDKVAQATGADKASPSAAKSSNDYSMSPRQAWAERVRNTQSIPQSWGAGRAAYTDSRARSPGGSPPSQEPVNGRGRDPAGAHSADPMGKWMNKILSEKSAPQVGASSQHSSVFELACPGRDLGVPKARHSTLPYQAPPPLLEEDAMAVTVPPDRVQRGMSMGSPMAQPHGLRSEKTDPGQIAIVVGNEGCSMRFSAGLASVAAPGGATVPVGMTGPTLGRERHAPAGAQEPFGTTVMRLPRSGHPLGAMQSGGTMPPSARSQFETTWKPSDIADRSSYAPSRAESAVGHQPRTSAFPGQPGTSSYGGTPLTSAMTVTHTAAGRSAMVPSSAPAPMSVWQAPAPAPAPAQPSPSPGHATPLDNGLMPISRATSFSAYANVQPPGGVPSYPGPQPHIQAAPQRQQQQAMAGRAQASARRVSPNRPTPGQSVPSTGRGPPQVAVQQPPQYYSAPHVQAAPVPQPVPQSGLTSLDASQRMQRANDLQQKFMGGGQQAHPNQNQGAFNIQAPSLLGWAKEKQQSFHDHGQHGGGDPMGLGLNTLHNLPPPPRSAPSADVNGLPPPPRSAPASEHLAGLPEMGGDPMASAGASAYGRGPRDAGSSRPRGGKSESFACQSSRPPPAGAFNPAGAGGGYGGMGGFPRDQSFAPSHQSFSGGGGGGGGGGQFALKVLTSESRWETMSFSGGDNFSGVASSFLSRTGLKGAFQSGLVSKMQTMVQTGQAQSSVDIVDLI